MIKSFFYTREIEQRKLDENGDPIPLVIDVTGEDGTVTKQVVTGKFETETVTVRDMFNVNKVIRTHSLSPTEAIILLDDGHEVSDVVDFKLKKPALGKIPSNIEYIKGRVWVQTEIKLVGKDLEKFYAMLEA